MPALHPEVHTSPVEAPALQSVTATAAHLSQMQLTAPPAPVQGLEGPLAGQ